jgi:hypothetical protein
MDNIIYDPRVSFKIAACARVARFFLIQFTKRGENIPNYSKLTNGQKMYQMVEIPIFQMEYASLFLSKALQKLPKVGFLVENTYTI